jgi:hypothetical protein
VIIVVPRITQRNAVTLGLLTEVSRVIGDEAGAGGLAGGGRRD